MSPKAKSTDRFSASLFISRVWKPRVLVPDVPQRVSDLTRTDLGLPDPGEGMASRPLYAHPSARVSEPFFRVQDFCKAEFTWLLSSAQGLCLHPPFTGLSPSPLHLLRSLRGPFLNALPLLLLPPFPPTPGVSPQAHSFTNFAACTSCPPLCAPSNTTNGSPPPPCADSA